MWMDRFLDEACFGPNWLKSDAIASEVVETLRHAENALRYLDLHAFVVMPNHVHILITPIADPSKLLHSVKGFSARKANTLLGRAGEPFWQREAYDHWVRSEDEFNRIHRYIEENPVRAGLAATAEMYRWSSAYAGPEAGMAGLEAHSTG